MSDRAVFDYVVVQDRDGWYVASVPTLPGCYTASMNLNEIEEKMADAIALHIDLLQPEADLATFVHFGKVSL